MIYGQPGYVPFLEAILRAMQAWHGDEVADLEAQFEATKALAAAGGGDKLAVALADLGPALPSQQAVSIFGAAMKCLRDKLCRGDLPAVYFGGPLSNGPHRIDAGWWATSDADDVLKIGYCPFGRPAGYHDRKPCYPVMVEEKKLESLLAPTATAKKRNLTAAERRIAIEMVQNTPELTRQEQRKRVLEQLPHMTELQLRDVLATAGPRRQGKRRQSILTKK